jgi:hypothetical protein
MLDLGTAIGRETMGARRASHRAVFALKFFVGFNCI